MQGIVQVTCSHCYRPLGGLAFDTADHEPEALQAEVHGMLLSHRKDCPEHMRGESSRRTVYGWTTLGGKRPWEGEPE